MCATRHRLSAKPCLYADQCKLDAILIAFWYFWWCPRPLLVGCYCCQCIRNAFWNFRKFYNPLDGTLGILLVSWSCCCCCCTGYEQLKSLKLCKSVLPRQNAHCNTRLPPVHLSEVASGRIWTPVPLELNQEAYILKHCATAHSSVLCTSMHWDLFSDHKNNGKNATVHCALRTYVVVIFFPPCFVNKAEGLLQTRTIV